MVCYFWRRQRHTKETHEVNRGRMGLMSPREIFMSSFPGSLSSWGVLCQGSSKEAPTEVLQQKRATDDKCLATEVQESSQQYGHIKDMKHGVVVPEIVGRPPGLASSQVSHNCDGSQHVLVCWPTQNCCNPPRQRLVLEQRFAMRPRWHQNSRTREHFCCATVRGQGATHVLYI